MSISNEIARINGNVQAALQTISDTGVVVPVGANSNNLPAAAAALANEKQDKYIGTNYAGCLLCVAVNGAITPLQLGEGLEIVDGVLKITASVAAKAICGQATCGSVVCGVI